MPCALRTVRKLKLFVHGIICTGDPPGAHLSTKPCQLRGGLSSLLLVRHSHVRTGSNPAWRTRRASSGRNRAYHAQTRPSLVEQHDTCDNATTRWTTLRRAAGRPTTRPSATCVRTVGCPTDEPTRPSSPPGNRRLALPFVSPFSVRWFFLRAAHRAQKQTFCTRNHLYRRPDRCPHLPAKPCRVSTSSVPRMIQLQAATRCQVRKAQEAASLTYLYRCVTIGMFNESVDGRPTLFFLAGRHAECRRELGALCP